MYVLTPRDFETWQAIGEVEHALAEGDDRARVQCGTGQARPLRRRPTVPR